MEPPATGSAAPRASTRTERSVGDPVKAPDSSDSSESEAFMPNQNSNTHPANGSTPTALGLFICDASSAALTPLA